MSILLQMWTSVPRELQDVALTPAAATSPEDSRVPAMTDMPETAQPATVSQYKRSVLVLSSIRMVTKNYRCCPEVQNVIFVLRYVCKNCDWKRHPPRADSKKIHFCSA